MIRRDMGWRAALRLVLLVPLVGCSGFFVKPTTTTTTSTGGSTTPTITGDFAYVANSSAGTTSISEFGVGSGTLSSLGSINVGFVPVAMAVAPSNLFLYVASAPGATNPGVYLYNVGTSGALTAANSGNVLATDTVAAMAISPDGNWLFTVNSDGVTMNEYQVNLTTGALTLASTITLPGVSCVLSSSTTTPATQSCSVAISPSGQYVVAALGTSGDAVFSYSSASGITGSSFNTIASGYPTTISGDFSVALDSNNYAYIARTSALAVYQLGSSVTSESNLALASNVVPRSVTLSRSGSFVFTANEGTSTVASYGISGSGTLTAASGSPFAGPAAVSALGVDNTGSYLLAVGYDASAGVVLYSISASGVLTQVAAAASGTNTVLPALVAMTH